MSGGGGEVSRVVFFLAVWQAGFPLHDPCTYPPYYVSNGHTLDLKGARDSGGELSGTKSSHLTGPMPQKGPLAIPVLSVGMRSCPQGFWLGQP